jgi:hypothetical protein
VKLLATLALALIGATPALAREVALELVLAIDASTSVDPEEFDLQRQGVRLAFEDRTVIEAIEAIGPEGLAVSVVQWAGTGEQRSSVGWTLVGDALTARAFASTVAAAPRMLRGVTDIGGAISFSLASIEANGFEGRRRVIDVSGDGTSDNQEVWRDRDRAVARGITINGLVVRGGDAPSHLSNLNIVEHYRRNVIGGEGAFLVTARNFEDFQEAIRRKLLCEILGPDADAPAGETNENRCSPMVLGDAGSWWRR